MQFVSDYLTICRQEQWRQGIFFDMDCDGDSLFLAPRCHKGAYCLPPLDSGENGFVWSRLRVDAVLPEDCSLRFYVQAADTSQWPQWEALRKSAESSDNTGIEPRLQDCFGMPLPDGCDVWLDCVGRFLWIAVELTATGIKMPEIRAVSVRMAGDHMIEYLPSIYRGHDFTARYLSIFNSMMQDVEDAVTALPRQLDTNSAGMNMLEYLAEWLCMEPAQPNLRRRLKTALQDFETMYTVAGIKRSVRRLTGRQPYLIEHFAVDPNRADCHNPTVYRRLYGEQPYRFFVLLPEGTFPRRDQMEAFTAQMQTYIPAGSEMALVLLKPCIQLDWHTYLGINSQIADYIPAVMDETVTIHYDTMIGGATS